MVKVENKIMSALGFDFLIEHAHPHATDLVKHLHGMGEGRVSTSTVCTFCRDLGQRERDWAKQFRVLHV